MSEFKELCVKLEHFVTPEWVIKSILEKEILTNLVIDPCTGTGIMSKIARAANYNVVSIDINDWGFEGTIIKDFLALNSFETDQEFTIFMNPPFSKTCEFVEKSFQLGARKIVMFQRWSFRESSGRKEFFEKYPLARIYLCGDRATTYRHDIPVNEKGRHYDPATGRELAGTPTAHGFFVWERGQEQSNPPVFMLYK